MHRDLPPRMVARTLKSGKRLFYYNGPRRIPLGSDLNAAREEWARLENSAGIADRFPAIAEGYSKRIIPTLRLSSQTEYHRAVKNLTKAFGKFALDEIRPADVKEHMRNRGNPGIHEKAVLSAIFKWARETGLFDGANPCQGVGFNKHEKQALNIPGKRERYVTDEEYAEVWAKVPPVVQDVMDLCLLTGQRLGDVLRWTRHTIKDGVLVIKQSKTGNDVGIRVEGELKTVLERIQARPREIQTMHLIADAKGQPMRLDQVYYAFVKNKGTADWQIRDLRKKAANDSPDLATAKALLGHASEQTTAQIYRTGKAEPVGPLKRKG